MNDSTGFIGFGQMGSRMSARLSSAGAKVVCYDAASGSAERITKAGMTAASSIAEVGSRACIVLLSLPNGDIVRSVIFGEGGLLSGADKPRMIVDLSTIGPKASIEVASRLKAYDIAWVEAPVSGGPKGAEAGTLAVMVACPEDVREEAAALLRPIGKVFHAGSRPGLAQVAKLANNMLSTAALVVTSEVMAMGAKAGLDPNVLLDIINAGSGRNSATVDKFPRAVVTGSFDYGFSTGLAYKDVRLCLDEAENFGVPMIVGAQVRQMMAATNARYGGDSDFTEVARIYEEWGGVPIRSHGKT